MLGDRDPIPTPKESSVRRNILSLSLLMIAGAACAEDSTTAPLVGAPSGARETATGEPLSTHSWEAPAIVVEGRSNQLRESDLIGSYSQPRWTARRLFTETRTYVIPEGQIEFEYWLTVQDAARKDDDGEAEIKQMYEVEMGLPYRFQLDLYQKYVKEGSDGPQELDSTKFEVRWALADWDVIWGNPTTYLEWTASNNDYDFIEGKLLFCDEFTERLHWATNLVWEEKTGGDRERSQEITAGVSYAAIDSKLAVGAEAKFGFVNTIDKGGTDERTAYDNEFLVGPSIQFRPSPPMHIDVAWLAGTTSDSPRSKMTMIAGWEF